MDTIVAIRVAAATSPGQYSSGPRVIVDFVVADRPSHVVLDCETAEECNALASSILAEIEAAMLGTTPEEFDKLAFVS